MHAFGRSEIAQPDGTHVAQRNFGGQVLAGQRDDRLRQQNLAPMRGAHDARGAVDGGAEVIVVAAFDDARVQPAAHAQREPLRCCRIGERLLQLYRRADGLDRVPEGGMHPVAGHFDNRAVVALDRRPG